MELKIQLFIVIVFWKILNVVCIVNPYIDCQKNEDNWRVETKDGGNRCFSNCSDGRQPFGPLPDKKIPVSEEAPSVVSHDTHCSIGVEIRLLMSSLQYDLSKWYTCSGIGALRLAGATERYDWFARHKGGVPIAAAIGPDYRTSTNIIYDCKRRETFWPVLSVAFYICVCICIYIFINIYIYLNRQSPI